MGAWYVKLLGLEPDYSWKFDLQPLMVAIVYFAIGTFTLSAFLPFFLLEWNTNFKECCKRHHIFLI